jgi:iron complex outermembrane recepter protein
MYRDEKCDAERVAVLIMTNGVPMRGLKNLTLVTMIALSLPVLALPADGSDPVKYNLKIDKQSLSTALQEFATQSGVQIIFFAKVTDGHEAPSLKGKFTAADAVARLLDHSDLTFQQLNPKTIQVEPKAATNDLKKVVGSSFTGPETNLQLAQVDQKIAQADSSTAQSQSAADNSQGPKDEKNSSLESKDSKETQIQEVVVTGSRLKQSAQDGAQAVQIYSKEQIDQSGQTTLADFLNTVPSVSLSIGENGYQTSGGQTTVTLRGLPVGTTLVLLNGRRIEDGGAASGIGRAFFDLNSIPVSAVDKIEIVGSGSSAVYGSDAIAGVINIILKQNFDGFEVNARYGGAAGIDETNLGTAFGKTWEKGAFSVTGSYQTRGGLSIADRELSASNDYTSYGGPDNNYAACYPGNVYSLDGSPLPGAPVGSSATYAAVSGGATQGKPPLSNFTYGALNACSLNFGTDIIPPTHRTGIYAQGHIDITTSVQLFTELMFSYVQEYDKLGPQTLFGYPPFQEYTVSASNPYNPFGTAVGVSDAFPSISQSFNFNTTFFRPLIGARGTVLDNWHWEVTGFQSTDWTRESMPNYIVDQTGLQNALNSSDPSVALNPFVSGSPGAGIQSFYSDGFQKYSGQDQTLQGLVNGTVFRLPSGPVSVALGGEYDRGKLDLDAVNDGYDPLNTRETYRRTSYAIFGEARVPIVGGRGGSSPGDILAVTVAGRRDHYSDFGSKTSPQFGIEWRPTDSLLLRGTYADAFKAPGLFDLYTPDVINQTVVTDPITGKQVFVNTTGGGNPQLQALTGLSRTFGLVYTSHMIPNLRIAVTNWMIDENKVIESVPAQYILDNESAFPGRVTRDSSGTITTVQDTLINFGSIHVAGVDYQLNYAYHSSFGVWSPSLNVSQTYRYTEALSAGSPTIDAVSYAQDTGAWAPRWKGTAALAWTRGPLSANVDGRYVGHYQDYDSTQIIGNFWLCDINLRYSLGSTIAPDEKLLRNSYIEVGGVNVFNSLPQFSNFKSDFVGYDATQADIRGRFLYVQLGVKW